MIDEYNLSEDLLFYLRDSHSGADNSAPSAKLEGVFGIGNATIRQIINTLRCNGQPVCGDANGYFYAKTHDEINNTVIQLLNKTKMINDAAQGLVIAHQVFYDGTEG